MQNILRHIAQTTKAEEKVTSELESKVTSEEEKKGDLTYIESVAVDIIVGTENDP